MKKLLNVNDLSEILDVPVSTIRYWCFLKKIKYYKIGRHLKFDEKDIEKFVESCMVQSRDDGNIQ